MQTPGLIHRLAEHIQLRKDTGHRRYHLLLAQQQHTFFRLEGYVALAYLMKEGYFSTMLLGGEDWTLEHVLEKLDLHYPRCEILTMGQPTNERMIAILNDLESNIRIVQCPGGSHSKNGAVYQAVSQLSQDAYRALQSYLKQDLIVIGLPEHEQHMFNTVSRQQEGNIYLVMPHQTDERNHLASRQERQLIQIPEPYDEFNTFFKTLSSLIIPDSITSIQATILSMQAIQQKPEEVPVVILASSMTRPASRETDLLEDSRPQVIDQPQIQEARNIAVQSSLPVSTKRNVKPASRGKRFKADLLLVTATNIEAKAVLERFPQRTLRYIHHRPYHDLGIVGDARTFMVQTSNMGSGGLGGSRVTVEEGIQALSPWSVIMVGIAFGVSRESQQIGDILIAQELQNYDPERVGSGPDNQMLKYPRGHRVTASNRLLNSFIANQYNLPTDWANPPNIGIGLILSGSKLVDHEGFRNQLLEIAPEAIGGEMEGVGLYEAASRKNVDWLLIKAICDWADGKKKENKSEYQKLAAENAARFAIHVIQQGSFSRRVSKRAGKDASGLLSIQE